MATSGAINLRVTAHCSQGGRKYMEDMFAVACERTLDLKDLKYAFFGIFDGHGGQEAARFAKDNLMKNILRKELFWSDKDEDVIKAIYDGFVETQLSMWKDYETWPKTSTGLPSTSGTTASVGFLKKTKLYIGHVGDSAVALGYQLPDEKNWKAQMLTEDHKPECASESERIRNCGGRVVVKAGVPRIVWNRPRVGHSGPVRRSTQFDEIPFLAVARSLGDLWSYNAECNQFVVSPEPDVTVTDLDPAIHRCLIFATDGLWNMMTADEAIDLVQKTVLRNNEQMVYARETGQERPWINPSKKLVEKALDKWRGSHMRADNTSTLTILLNHGGPPHAQALLNKAPASQVSEPSEGNILIPGQVVLQPSVSNTSEEVCDWNSNVTQLECSSISDVVTFTRHAIVSSGMEYEDTSEVECLDKVEDARLLNGKSKASSSARAKSLMCENGAIAKLSKCMSNKNFSVTNNKPVPRTSKVSGKAEECGNCLNKKEKRVITGRQTDEVGAKRLLFRLSDSLLGQNSCIHKTQTRKRVKGEASKKPKRRLSEGILGQNLLVNGSSSDKTNVKDLGMNRSRRSSEGTLRPNRFIFNCCDENYINKLNPKHSSKSSENSLGWKFSPQVNLDKTNKPEKHLFGAEILKPAKINSPVARSNRTLRSSGPTRTLFSRNVIASTGLIPAAQDVKNKRGLSPCRKMNSDELHAGLKGIHCTASPLRKKRRSSDWNSVQRMVTRSQASRRHSK